MSAKDGKEFEQRFADQWGKAFPNYLIQRLYDQVTKYKDVSQNPSDYYTFIKGKLLYIECKETEKNTLNFSAFSQLDRLLELEQYDNVYGWVIIWYQTAKKVIMVSAKEANKIRQDGNASINIKMLEKGLYNILEVPCEVPRKYPICDFKSIIDEILEGD